jgi:hypothetical protein
MNQGERFAPDAGWPQLTLLEPSGWHSLALARVSVKATKRHQLSSGPTLRPGYGQDGVNWSKVAGHRDGLALERTRVAPPDSVGDADHRQAGDLRWKRTIRR